MAVTTCRYALAREAVRARSGPSVKGRVWPRRATRRGDAASGKARGRGSGLRVSSRPATLAHTWRTPRREQAARRVSVGQAVMARVQAFRARSCPPIPSVARLVPPRQGGGHWFEPSIAHQQASASEPLQTRGFCRLTRKGAGARADRVPALVRHLGQRATVARSAESARCSATVRGSLRRSRRTRGIAVPLRRRSVP